PSRSTQIEWAAAAPLRPNDRSAASKNLERMNYPSRMRVHSRCILVYLPPEQDQLILRSIAQRCVSKDGQPAVL
ncbi:MAG TPA: hypothetical protein VF915_16455, partial [Reyranella sp.]